MQSQDSIVHNQARAEKIKQNSPLSVRIIMVGDQAVGKTVVIKKLLNIDLSSSSSNGSEAPQIDFAIQTVKLQDNIIETLYIWTTTGQTQNIKLMAPYLRRCDIYIIVFSVDNLKTYQNALDIWLPECQKWSAPDSTIMLMGTKLDCERVCPPKSFIADSLKQGLLYSECSAHNGIGITQCQQLLFQALIAKHSIIKPEEPILETKELSPPQSESVCSCSRSNSCF